MTPARLLTLALTLLITASSAIAGGSARLVHPNPFTDGCTFTLTMPSQGKVRIIVYDLLGRQVANLTERLQKDEFEEGTHPIEWDGKDQAGDPVPPGTYVCVLWTEGGEMINSVKVVKAMGVR